MTNLEKQIEITTKHCIFRCKFYPNPENFTPSRMVWMVTFFKSGLVVAMSVWVLSPPHAFFPRPLIGPQITWSFSRPLIDQPDLQSISNICFQLSKRETVWGAETIFCEAYWGHFWCKTTNSETTLFLSNFCNESFCHLLFWLTLFMHTAPIINCSTILLISHSQQHLPENIWDSNVYKK